MNPLKQIIALVITLVVVLGCTRDDICPEDTPTTPLLIITFKDFANRTSPKTVEALEVRDATNDSIILFNTASTDSIAIPLRNFTNRTELVFTSDANSTGDLSGGANTDQFNLVYTLEDIYLNRACGFIANYNDLSGQLIDEDGGNWIFSFEILQNDVTNQDEAHLTLFH